MKRNAALIVCFTAIASIACQAQTTRGRDFVPVKEAVSAAARVVEHEKAKTDFERDAAAFRSKSPVYEQFAATLEKQIVPIIEQGRVAHANLLALRKEKGDQALQNVEYDGQLEKALTDKLVKKLFWEMAGPLQSLVTENGIVLPKETQRNFSLTGFKQRFDSVAKLNGAEFESAFSDDEAARMIFENNLVEPVSVTTHLFLGIAIALPPELQKRLEDIDSQQTTLTKQKLLAPRDQKLYRGILETRNREYFEPYTKRIYGILQKSLDSQYARKKQKKEAERKASSAKKPTPAPAATNN